MRLHREVERFVVAKRQEGLSSQTLRQYDWHLRRLCTWLVKRDVDRAGEVTVDLLRAWGAGLYDAWQPATVRQAIIAVRSWFGWLVEEGVLDASPAAGLRLPKVHERAQRTLSSDEIRAMLGECERDGSIRAVRDGAIISLLVDGGLRAAELCRLEIGDVDLDACMLTVEVKGGSTDYGYFGEATVERLRRWLAARPGADGEAAVFVAVGGSRPGRRLTTRGLRVIVKRAGERAGVAGVSPHAFRRSFACLASDAGAPAHVIMRAGRWSNVNMVVRYTRAMRRRELYEKRGWVPTNHLGDIGDVDHDP